MLGVPQFYEFDFSWEFDGIAWMEPASSLVFDVRNRLVGGWVCDELVKRDPKLAHNPGNMFHEAYKMSFLAEQEHEQMKKDSQQSALSMWETARRNPALMERLTERLAAGDPNAWQELSPETMFKHALRENPAELRRKDFWRSI
jgi:hypothetical protein